MGARRGQRRKREGVHRTAKGVGWVGGYNCVPNQPCPVSARAETEAVWPRKEAVSSPDSSSQTRQVWSPAALMTRRFGEMQICVISAV